MHDTLHVTFTRMMHVVAQVLWSCHAMWDGTQSFGSGKKEKKDPAAITAVGYKLLNEYFDHHPAE